MEALPLERGLKSCFYFSFTAGVVVHHQGWPQDTSGHETVWFLNQCLNVYSSLEGAQTIPALAWEGRELLHATLNERPREAVTSDSL